MNRWSSLTESDTTMESMKNLPPVDGKIHHIGILVYAGDEISRLLQLLGWKIVIEEYNEAYGVETSFLENSDNALIELFQPINNEGLKKELRRRGQFIHHIAFEVDDIQAAMDHLQENGYETQQKSAEVGVGGSSVVFLNPLVTKGLIIELIEVRK